MSQECEWCDPSPYVGKGIVDVTPELMDAAIGFMNRRLQMLIDSIAEQLYAMGAFSKGSLGRVCSEYADGNDFYSTILGVQVRVYLAGTNADPKDGANLGLIVRSRNHFLYKYPKILRNSSGKVPAGEFQLLRDTIAAIERRSDSFDEALAQMRKVQDKAQTLAGGKNNHSKSNVNVERVKRCIDDAIPRDRSMIAVSQLNGRLRTLLPGMDPQRVLGMKVADYLKGCKEYYLKDTNGGLKVGRI